MPPARASRSAVVAVELFREGDCVWLLGADPRLGKEPIVERIDLPPGEVDVAANLVRRGTLTGLAEETLTSLCSAIAAPIGAACCDADALALAQHGCLHLLPTGCGAVDGGRPLAATLPVAQVPSTSYLRRIAAANFPYLFEDIALLTGPELGEDSAVAQTADEIGSALSDPGIPFRFLDQPRKLKPGTVLIAAGHGRPSQILMRKRGGAAWMPAEEFAAAVGRPALVVLAVCRSGTADVAPDDEPLGLVWPLLAGGCHSVVSSLWDVVAPAAAAFAGTLIGQVFAGRSIGEAFADATGKQACDPRFSSFRDRCGFVLYGDWRPSLSPR